MAGGITIIVFCVLALIGAGELLIRAVEWSIARQGADPMQGVHGDVAAPIGDELQHLRDWGAL